MHENDYAVKLDIFEGPMDLLIYLVRKNDIDIHNIPISTITDEYLSFLDYMQALNIDYAADFLYMASTLTYLKSKVLLPSDSNSEEDEDDPLLELTRPLLEYLQLKMASENLMNRDVLGVDTFTRDTPNSYNDNNENREMVEIGLFELIEAFKNITSGTYEDHVVELNSNTMSVKDRINEISLILESEGSTTFLDLFNKKSSNIFKIITFLAILEMAKLNIIEIRQHIQSGIIKVFYL